MGFPRQENWSGLLFPSPEDLPDPRIALESPAWQADSLPVTTWESLVKCETLLKQWSLMCYSLEAEKFRLGGPLPSTANDGISSIQSLSHVQLFVVPWTAARQASLSITNSWCLLKPMSVELQNMIL